MYDLCLKIHQLLYFETLPKVIRCFIPGAPRDFQELMLADIFGRIKNLKT